LREEIPDDAEKREKCENEASERMISVKLLQTEEEKQEERRIP